ncbi:XdhC family protein [Rhizomonospora bruguierae]|uniref:XdhC family protein n=1 Tax=Rhizomonospora bruguierae TaxID=1581705 RepID=UPI001BD1334E|nr:XdhC family protein [Micromonospora sp. NBRC 107566]
MADPHLDPACAVAHGAAPPGPTTRALVAVFASPVARHLLHFAADAGYATTLVEPVWERADGAAHRVASALDPSFLDGDTDVVVTDHHRPELGVVLRDALAYRSRWIGVIGNVRHVGPHVAALRELGVPDAEVARIHRPIGLDIGSKTPAEIAIATLAGLIADRNGRPGGFAWGTPAAAGGRGGQQPGSRSIR